MGIGGQQKGMGLSNHMVRQEARASTCLDEPVTFVMAITIQGLCGHQQFCDICCVFPCGGYYAGD